MIIFNFFLSVFFLVISMYLPSMSNMCHFLDIFADPDQHDLMDACS